MWEIRPLSHLSWGPGEWCWPSVVGEDVHVSFFEYSVQCQYWQKDYASLAAFSSSRL